MKIVQFQINDYGFELKNFSLRNAYDVFLLSKKVDTKKTISKFTKLKNPLNCFLANCNLVFGDLESLEYHKKKETDTKATYEILKAQVEKYDDLENNISFLSNFSTRRKFADLAGFIVFNEKNQECFSFGKHKGKLVIDILKTDSGYFNWLLNADFPLYTKNILKSIKLKLLNNKLS